MSNTPSTFDPATFVKKYLKPIIAAIVVVVLGFSILAYVNYTIGVRNEGERQEQDLSALYNQSKASLSACLDQGQIAAQVTEKEYDSLKEILVGTASARYVDANGNSTNASGVLGGGQFISALQENYPQVDQRSWQNLQTVVVGCRDEFQGKQDQIQVFAATFNKWRVSNNLVNANIKSDFPSNELKVTTETGDTLYGMAAYDRITRVVSVADATKAFETGKLDQQDLFSSGK